MSRILLVDDDADSLALLAALLERRGHTTRTAGSLADARRELALRGHETDVVVTDLDLGDGSGLALCVGHRPPPAFVLLTGHTDVTVPAGVRVLIKPVDPQALLSALDGHQTGAG